jgi:hypothetical protein
MPGDAIAVVAGLTLIGFAVREIFRDLFYPSDSGVVSDWIARSLFDLLRRARSWLPLAGPAAVVLVIVTWVAMLAVGFALLYYAGFPDQFRSDGLLPSGQARVWTSLYFSLETLVSAGYGDLVPGSILFHFIAAVEGLLGFGVLTASVSSVILLFNALSRMRVLALTIRNVVYAEDATHLLVIDGNADVLIGQLARDAAQARVDLIHQPIVYYFETNDPDASLVRWIPHLSRLAAAGQQSQLPPKMRISVAMLNHALDDLARVLGRRVPRHNLRTRDDVFTALAEDHVVQAHA